MHRRQWAAWTLAVLSFGGAGLPLSGQDAAEKSTPTLAGDAKPLAFAYDPEQEEGPHPDADFEWWYQFGFLKRTGAPKFEYSFVSSFQRNKLGRYLFYNLSDLTTGKNFHYALADRSLFEVTDKPAAPLAQDDGAKSPREPAGLGQRLTRWLQDTLPLLPEGHKFMTPPDPAAQPPKSELWLDYDDHCFHKDGSAYRAVYKHPESCLDLTLQRAGPALPVLGTGLTGLAKPEDQHYYTYPRMPTRGLLRMGKTEETPVEGSFWYDHQWGKVVTKVPLRWCWWGLRLEDGRNLSLFFLQDSRSGKTVQEGLTVQNPDGRIDVYQDLIFTPGRSWKSPHGRSYHVEWQVEACINALDEPLPMVIDYKDLKSRYRNDDRLGSALEWVGQETSFEHLSDEELKAAAYACLARVSGAKDPRQAGIIHESLNRNTSNHERYLLTDPGTLKFRPRPKTTFRNLFLAGDWIRNEVDVPTMEGAVCSGYHVQRAELMLTLGTTLRDDGQLADSRIALETALDDLDVYLQAVPRSFVARNRQAQTYRSLAATLGRLGEATLAAEARAKANRLRRDP